ncbi:MAG: hypothetical protein HQL70_02580 [Magnetococcales bacterium]|nr:hypothetical protein [Magnetococcales bacterium]
MCNYINLDSAVVRTSLTQPLDSPGKSRGCTINAHPTAESRIKIFFFALLVLLITPKNAVSNSYTCQKIVNYCQSENNIEYGSCLGYFAGMSSWEIFLQSNSENHEIICFPKKVTTGRLKKAFLKYTAQHPENLQKGASLCFYYAMSQAFPCKTTD